MLRTFISQDGRLHEAGDEDAPGAVWYDLMAPSSEEETRLEARLNVGLPTREEMAEIEISSRLYAEDGALVMIANLPALADGGDPVMGPVSFVLTGGVLVTVRYHEPRAFQTFPIRAEKVAMGCDTGEHVLIALLEAVVDRLADILEHAGGEIDVISRDVFRRKAKRPTPAKDFQKILEEIGRKGELLSHMRESLVTLERLVSFLGADTIRRKSTKSLREQVKTLTRDVRSLSDHAGFLSQKITFLLDATLGMISIEQNAIIKIFSVAAVAFLPPTLIASIYGMNFEHMPELSWSFGYPLALGVMVLAAVLPYLFFRQRGWL